MNASFRSALLAGEQLGQRYALSVPQAALTGLSGAQLARHPGSSLDFQDYREYEPGDDLRRIDWNVFARTDKLTVKLFREEVNPHLDLLIDGSRSMNLEDSRKAEALLKLAAVFATAAENSRCTHTAWLAAGGFQKIPNGTERPSLWDGIHFDGARPLAEEFAVAPPKLRRAGIRVLLGDLFWPGNPSPTLRRLAEGAAAVFVVQVFAQADAEPPEQGNLRMVDSESGEMVEIFVDAMVAQRYRDDLARHQQAWHLACRQMGARMTTLIAEPLLTADSLRSLEETEILTPA